MDLTGVSPSRVHLSQDGVIDWTRYDHIQHFHTRKAGGSSLRMFGQRVARKHNLTFGQQEGTTYDPKQWSDRDFVYTSLRPSVERAISGYEYDVLQLSKTNITHAISIDDFYARTYHGNIHKKSFSRDALGNKISQGLV
jgi:hypothetical protein